MIGYDKTNHALLIKILEETYFLFFLPFDGPPVESKNEASRVAGFLEARNAEIRRYFAETDKWKSNSSSCVPNFFTLVLPFTTSDVALTSCDEMLNT